MGYMGVNMHRYLLTLCLILAGCGTDTTELAQVEIADVAEDTSSEVAQGTVPTILAVEEAIQAQVERLPEPEPVGYTPHIPTVNLIVRWEVTGQSVYNKKYQGIICPPGASGPTWAIGYDGGHQTRRDIVKAWGFRPDAERLSYTSGQMGPSKCRNARTKLLDVRVPYKEAHRVFAYDSLPSWENITKRLYPGVEKLGPYVLGSLVANTYNRGTVMSGNRARHKIYIRDTCVKKLKDAQCVADVLIESCEIWEHHEAYNGLCNRRRSEATFAIRKG